jgi:hypothetical protein
MFRPAAILYYPAKLLRWMYPQNSYAAMPEMKKYVEGRVQTYFDAEQLAQREAEVAVIKYLPI